MCEATKLLTTCVEFDHALIIEASLGASTVTICDLNMSSEAAAATCCRRWGNLPHQSQPLPELHDLPRCGLYVLSSGDPLGSLHYRFGSGLRWGRLGRVRYRFHWCSFRRATGPHSSATPVIIYWCTRLLLSVLSGHVPCRLAQAGLQTRGRFYPSPDSNASISTTSDINYVVGFQNIVTIDSKSPRLVNSNDPIGCVGGNVEMRQAAPQPDQRGGLR